MNTDGQGGLPDWIFESAFPFAFAWDETLHVIACGRSLRRLLPEAYHQHRITELFDLQRPAGDLSAAWLDAHKDTLMLLTLCSTELMLRGQVIATQPGGPWIFVGTPWIKSPEHLDEFEMSLGDFAPHDPTVDMLYVVQAQKMGNRELREVNRQLNEKSRLLADREQQARKLAIVAERTENAVVIADHSGKIEWVNEAFERMTGWELAEVVGRKPGSFLQGPLTDPSVVELMRSRIRQGLGFSVETLNYRKDRRPYWASLEVRPVTDDCGVVTHFMAVEADVTASKQQETRRGIAKIITDVIMSESGLGEVVTSCALRLAKLLGAGRVAWWATGRNGSKLHLIGDWPAMRHAVGPVHPHPPGSMLDSGEGLVGRAWESRSTLWSTETQDVAGSDKDDTALDGVSRYAIAIPVAAGTRFFGVFELVSDFFLPPDADLLSSLDQFGAQVGLLLKRLEAEQAFQQAERIAQLGNWSMDVTTGHLGWSEATFRIHGCEPHNEGLDVGFHQRFVHPEDQDRVKQQMARSIETGMPFEIEYRVILPDRRIRHLKCNAEMVTDMAGHTVSLFGTVLDITALVLARAELVESEQRWQLALENNGLGVWDWDLESGRMIYTETLMTMLGYGQGDWENIATSWMDRIHPDDRDTVSRAIRFCLDGDSREYISEHRILCKDESWKWVQHSGRIVVYSAEGRPLRMVGTQMDIHIRKATEETSRRRTDLVNRIRLAQNHYIGVGGLAEVYREMVETAVTHTESEFGFMGEVLHDENGAPYVKSYGIIEVSGNEGEARMPASIDYEGFELRDLKSLAGAAIVGRDVVIANDVENDPRPLGLPPGHSFLSSFLALPVFHGLEMIGLIGLANRPGGYDMDLVNELDPFHAATSSMIVGRREEENRRRTEEILRAARDKAEAANRAKSSFLAMISHEIRTPMNGMLGMASLLRESPLSHQQVQMADAMLQSGRSLVTIINDILDFSKVESGQMALSHDVIALDALVEGVADLLALETVAKDVELFAMVDSQLRHPIRGDSVRIRQILLNLVSNAVKFTESGSVVLRAVLIGDELEFSVTDTGIGITLSDQERLFEPFSQIDNSSSRHHGGTGLGLAICKKLVDLMGGDIGLESGDGGSRFWFRILHVPADDEKSASARRPVPPAGIWVADPSSLRRESVSAAFADGSSDITEISCMEDLTLLVREAHQAPDVVFLDGVWFTDHLMDLMKSRGWDARNGAPRFVIAGNPPPHMDPHPVFTRLPKPLHRSHILHCVFPQQDSAGHPTKDARITSTQRLRVLIAEDNPVNAALVRMILGKRECHCECVVNGAEAVEKFKQGRFDTVLMDCNMPVMDGYEAARRIRAIEKENYPGWHPCRIIAITANALEGERARCADAGMDDYLSKPFEAHALIHLLLESQESSWTRS